METATLSQFILIAHDPGSHPGDGTDGIPARKARAAGLLAPVITAVTSLRPSGVDLLGLGFKFALQEDMAGLCQPHHVDQVPPTARERLLLARNITRLKVDLLTAPETLIIYAGAAVTLLGDPPCLEELFAAEYHGWQFL